MKLERYGHIDESDWKFPGFYTAAFLFRSVKGVEIRGIGRAKERVGAIEGIKRKEKGGNGTGRHGKG